MTSDLKWSADAEELCQRLDRPELLRRGCFDRVRPGGRWEPEALPAPADDGPCSEMRALPVKALGLRGIEVLAKERAPRRRRESERS